MPKRSHKLSQEQKAAFSRVAQLGCSTICCGVLLRVLFAGRLFFGILNATGFVSHCLMHESPIEESAATVRAWIALHGLLFNASIKQSALSATLLGDELRQLSNIGAHSHLTNFECGSSPSRLWN